ncbi:MAG: hypothetical protein FWE11_09890 [Defluviitaleaceae bacterium]|nr:hypothetical protein [Defluviitaleaceae bacterium]
MDINCTHTCFYQTEGKCTLRELPSFVNTAYNAYDIDCPYYHDTSPRTVAGAFH